MRSEFINTKILKTKFSKGKFIEGIIHDTKFNRCIFNHYIIDSTQIRNFSQFDNTIFKNIKLVNSEILDASLIIGCEFNHSLFS